MKYLIFFFIIGLITIGNCNVIKREEPPAPLLSDELDTTNIKDNVIIPEEIKAIFEETTGLKNEPESSTLLPLQGLVSQNMKNDDAELPQPKSNDAELPIEIELKKDDKELLVENNVKSDDAELMIETKLKSDDVESAPENSEDNTDDLRLITTEQNEGSDGLRQNAGSTTQRPGIIQQFVQNNPISSFIQNIRPRPTSQPGTGGGGTAQSNDAAAQGSTTPPNIFQQGLQTIQHNIQNLQQNLQQQVQGLSQNIQGFINPNAVQSTNTTTRPPFNIFNNLFPQQNATSQQQQTGGPIQNILGGLFGGGNNNNRDSPSTTTATTLASAELTTLSTTNIASSVIDEVNDRPDSSENEHDIYVGDDDVSQTL